MYTVGNIPGMADLPIVGINQGTSLGINRTADLPTASLVVDSSVSLLRHSDRSVIQNLGAMATAPEVVPTMFIVNNETIDGSLADGNENQPFPTASSHLTEEVLLTIQSSAAVLTMSTPEAVNPVSGGGDAITAPPSRVAPAPMLSMVDSSLPKITIETARIASPDEITTPDGDEVTTPARPVSAPIASAAGESVVVATVVSGRLHVASTPLATARNEA